MMDMQRDQVLLAVVVRSSSLLHGKVRMLGSLSLLVVIVPDSACSQCTIDGLYNKRGGKFDQHYGGGSFSTACVLFRRVRMYCDSISVFEIALFLYSIGEGLSERG